MRFEIKPLPDDEPEEKEKEEVTEKAEPERGAGSVFFWSFVTGFIVAASIAELLYLFGFNWVEFIYSIFNRHPC